MAACSRLHHVFESSFADEKNFGELHFKEKSISEASPVAESKSSQDINDGDCVYNDSNKAYKFYPRIPIPGTHSYTDCRRKTDSFSSFHSERLQLCTEGLGFESTDDVEKMTYEKLSPVKPYGEHGWRSRSSSAVEFPPPISIVGKPWVSFRSYRHDGRLVLKEIRRPNHEFLHASREDGRLKLRFLHSSDHILDDEEECKEE